MPVKIFFCYAHEDEQLLNKLKSQLTPLQRQGLIDVWHDRDISAGTDWEQQIKGHLNEAQIILLLVSPDFMSSDYCYSIEMKRALELHEREEARVIPIILRYVYWRGILGKLQALPTDARPIKSWPDLDEALYNVTEGIRKGIEEITPTSSPPPTVPSTQPVSPTQPSSLPYPKWFISPVSYTQPVSQTPLPTNLPDKSQKTKEQWLAEGSEYLDLKQYSEALVAYDQAIRLDPKDAIAYSNKGFVLINLWRYEEALAACEQALRLSPKDAAAYFLKGIALYELKRYEEAVVAYEQAIRLDPNNADAYLSKGNALIKLKRYEEAVVAYEQAIRLDPNNAEAYQNKGNALNGLNRKWEAEPAYEKARQLGYRA